MAGSVSRYGLPSLAEKTLRTTFTKEHERGPPVSGVEDHSYHPRVDAALKPDVVVQYSSAAKLHCFHDTVHTNGSLLRKHVYKAQFHLHTALQPVLFMLLCSKGANSDRLQLP